MPLEPAEEVDVERDELEQVSLRLPAKDLAELRRQAAEKGIGYTTLIRMILREHLIPRPTSRESSSYGTME